MGTEEGWGWGAGAGRGFLKIALEDFIKEFWGVGVVDLLSHLGPSGVSLQASFFLFLIYNYNI